VDEDAGKYYRHTIGTNQVTSVDLGVPILGFCEDENNATLWLEGEKDGFQDNKLCRVRQLGENPEDLQPFEEKRKSFLQSPACDQSFWFELSCRFGKQLSIDQWLKESASLRGKGKKFVKLVGFDGANTMLGTPWEKVKAEVEKFDVLLWDADWFNEEGWTGLIPGFLAGKPHRLAVAFQKKREVPGFHRQYWHVYKRFPDRVWIVVFDDSTGEENPPKAVADKLAWLEQAYADGRLKKPDTWAGARDRYVQVALMAREVQGLTPVIAINGGRTAAAQVAVETAMPGVQPIPWTVFPGKRTKQGDSREEEPNSTVLEFARAEEANAKNPNISLVDGGDDPAKVEDVEILTSASPCSLACERDQLSK